MPASRVIDTTRYSYDEWIRFAFDHPVTEEPWYCSKDVDYRYDAPTVIGYYTRLFLDPPAALLAYDEAHLQQGCWFIGLKQLSDWIWDEKIPRQLRLECIESMSTLFRKFLIDRPLDDVSYMWWDWFAYSFDGEADRVIVEAMFQALREILSLPARHCRYGALHGLGHLDHESKESVIRAYLKEHHYLDERLVRYAEEAISGRVMKRYSSCRRA
jgi:hypothetical protein